MKRLLIISLALTGTMPNCVSWDQYYGSENQQVEKHDRAYELIAIPADNQNSFYMVDQQRGLCFLEKGGMLTAIDCDSVQGVAHLLGRKPSRPEQVERVPNPIERPASKKTKNPSEATPQEVEAFTTAYTEIVCQSRIGAEFSPHEVIAKHGLTASRYTQIEGLLARQKKRWLALTRNARKACGGSAQTEPEPGSNGEKNDAEPTN